MQGEEEASRLIWSPFLKWKRSVLQQIRSSITIPKKTGKERIRKIRYKNRNKIYNNNKNTEAAQKKKETQNTTGKITQQQSKTKQVDVTVW